MSLTRRAFVGATGLVVCAPAVTRLQLTSPANAEVRQWRHGLSLLGELRYPAEFPHFGYVNPHAPKAGGVRLSAFGTYDSFNVVTAGLKGQLAAGIDLVHETC